MTNNASAAVLSLADRVDSSCDQFEARWGSDQSLSIEDVLADFDSDDTEAALSELVAVELELRFRRGETLSVDEYANRFPQHRDLISRLFSEVLDDLMITQAAAGHGSSSSSDQGRLETTAGSDQQNRSSRPPQQGDSATLPVSIGKYRVVEALGRGGQASVYRAVHPQLGRDVVIKYCHTGQVSDPAAREALQSEGRVLSELAHPNLAKVYDFDFDNGRAYLVMEYVRGLNLAQYARQNTLSASDSTTIVRQIAEALAYVHSHGVLHLDIKPQNILIDSSGKPFLIDFGLARAETAWDQSGPDPDKLSGTVVFMSPEQARCDTQSIGPRSDIFGLGGVLYYLLTGAPPIRGESLRQSLQHAQRGNWERKLLDEKADAKLRGVVERAMATDPLERFPDAEAMARELDSLVTKADGTDRAPQNFSRTPRRIIAAVALLAVTAVGALLVMSRDASEPSLTPETAATAMDSAAGTQTAQSEEDASLQPLQMHVRVWRDGNTSMLADSIPLHNGDRVEVRSHVPAGMAVALYFFDSTGELSLADARPPAESDYEYRFPEDRDYFTEVVGAAGTEFLLLCGSRQAPITEAEMREFGLFSRAWPQLPPEAMIELRGESTELVLRKRSRPFGNAVETDDPQQQVLDSVQALQEKLAARGEAAAGVAFPHVE